MRNLQTLRNLYIGDDYFEKADAILEKIGKFLPESLEPYDSYMKLTKDDRITEYRTSEHYTDTKIYSLDGRLIFRKYISESGERHSIDKEEKCQRYYKDGDNIYERYNHSVIKKSKRDEYETCYLHYELSLLDDEYNLEELVNKFGTIRKAWIETTEGCLTKHDVKITNHQFSLPNNTFQDPLYSYKDYDKNGVKGYDMYTDCVLCKSTRFIERDQYNLFLINSPLKRSIYVLDKEDNIIERLIYTSEKEFSIYYAFGDSSITIGHKIITFKYEDDIMIDEHTYQATEKINPAEVSDWYDFLMNYDFNN